MTDETIPAPPPDDGRRRWVDKDGRVHGVIFTDVVDLLIEVNGDKVTYYPHKPGEPPQADQPAA
ncbi:MAG: hypothetical protein K2X82_08025 [Gemmataceae bacterium]|nr:hypothetical protein [Gemmataceae bacterium]